MRPRLTLQIVSAVCAALAAAACGGSTTVTEVTGPESVRCQTSVSAAPASVPAAGNRVTLTVTAARECRWSASSEASWLQVSPTSGQGEGSVTLTVAANPEGRSRTGAVVVNDHRLSLAQEAAPCQYDVSPDTIRLSHDGGRAAFRISATAACPWQASSGDGWLRVLNSSGSSDGTVEVEVSPNTARTPRVATLAIAGQNVRIMQDSQTTPTPSPTPNPNPPNPNPNPNPTCNVSLDSPERSFGPSGGEGSFRVNVQEGCRWTASSPANWVDIMGSATATRSDNVRYRVAENLTTSARSAAINVSGQTHMIRQEGAQPAPPPRNGGEKVEVSGHAFLVEGSCPKLTFVVEGRQIFTTDDTNFKGNCRRLQTGTEVSVEGRLQSDGRVRATEVDIDDDD